VERKDNNKGKILVVDDDRLVLATVTHGLSRAGYDVIDADNGDDAILLARAERPDLALLDIRMEGMSGFDVAAYLREYLQIPFMFLSAFADEATVDKVRELGAVAYLVKPLDIAQIIPTVDAALNSVRQRRQAVPLAEALAPSSPAAPAPTPAARPPAAPAQASPLTQAVPIAVGVLMHRYSLSRSEALQRLERLAAEDGRTLETQAGAMIDALELLSRPGQG